MESVLDKLASASEAYNPIFQDLSRPIADVLGLENLGPHFDVFVYSFVLFNLASIVLVPGLSRLFFKRVYGALDGKARNKWYVSLPPSPEALESECVSSPQTDQYRMLSIFCHHATRRAGIAVAYQ